MRESSRKLVRCTFPRSERLRLHILTLSIALTIQSHKIARVGSGKDRGFTKCGGKSRGCCKSGRGVLEHVRQIHIGSSIVHPAVCAVPHIIIDYTATSDSYTALVTAHFPPQHCERKLVQATKVRESPCTRPRGKIKGAFASSLNTKFSSIEDWKAWRRRAGRYSLVSCLCCTSVLWNALLVDGGPRFGQMTKHGWQVLKLPYMDLEGLPRLSGG